MVLFNKLDIVLTELKKADGGSTNAFQTFW